MRIKVPFIHWIYGLRVLYLTILCAVTMVPISRSGQRIFWPECKCLAKHLLSGCHRDFLFFCYFAFRFLPAAQSRKIDSIWLIVLFLAISSLYVGSFFEVLAPNGDNAEYIINAKSIIELGGVYRLETPNQTPNSLASLGLPFLINTDLCSMGIGLFSNENSDFVIGLNS